ncbi:hypothetical protein CYMTET_15042 [Cymbomonas tetramitiformis]|uniref:Uncharacterized protein n=1 Tax=Cymbomonas tetramitiformis TaxID=36881 RepID=A0AAE0GFC9_9CHLO|nr:hypothetical protein CYMTET_15042 [Cymbomonas tetramitiformis]
MALCFEHRPLCHLCKVTNAILKSVFKLGPKKRPLVAVLFVCLFLIHQESASSQGTIPVAPTTVDADESIAGPRRQLLSCTDLPEGNTWHDGSSWGNCNTYYSNNLCTSSGGYGSGWLTEWGSFSGWTSYGLDATEACCVCGGGSRREYRMYVCAPPVLFVHWMRALIRCPCLVLLELGFPCDLLDFVLPVL